jgi:hypothetical protein
MFEDDADVAVRYGRLKHTEEAVVKARKARRKKWIWSVRLRKEDRGRGKEEVADEGPLMEQFLDQFVDHRYRRGRGKPSLSLSLRVRRDQGSCSFLVYTT